MMSDLQATDIESPTFPKGNISLSQGALTLGRPLTFSKFEHGIKRSIDVAAASVGLFLLWPLFLVIGALVSIDGGPVFYRHTRIGKNGEAFGCLKFRTMILDAAECLDEYLSYHPAAAREWAEEQKLSFDPRITFIGRLLRQTSLDELPQLFNVLRGEMSLVGPRPVTEKELLQHYGSSAEIYKSVLPGITGLWQISGRNNIGYAERVRLDEQYARTRNIAVDLSILVKTPSVVISRKGAR